MGLWETIYVGVVLSAMFTALYRGFYTSEVVVFTALIVIWNARIINTDDALSGFSNRGMLAVGILFVVVKGIEKCQLVDRLARHVFGLNTSARMGLLRMMTMTYILSAFLNNTPIVAALIPVTKDWARMRGFAPSVFLMPLSFSCILGGMLTIIGTSTNLVVNGIVQDAGIEPISFFEPGYVALPIGIVSLLFIALMAPIILPKSAGLFSLVRDRTGELITEIEIDETCNYVGEPIAIIMAKLNLPLEALIKIRRKVADFDKSTVQHATLRGEPKDKYRNTMSSAWGQNVHASSSVIEMGFVPAKAEDVEMNNVLIPARESINSVPMSEMPVLNMASVIQTGDSYQDIYPVQPQERIEANDILFLSCAQSAMVQFNTERIAAPIKGLKILDVHALDLPGYGTQFFEIVLGSGNKFDGRSVATMRAQFSKVYGGNVIAVRRKDQGDDDNLRANSTGSGIQFSPLRPVKDENHENSENTDMLSQRLNAGDLVLVLAKDEFAETWKHKTGALHKDFFIISSVGKVSDPVRWVDYIPIAIFIGMLVWVVIEEIDMVQAAMAAAVVLIVFGFISAKEAVQYVDWSLLLLIGSALGLSKAVDKSGLAGYVADFIADAGFNDRLSLLIILLFTIAMTELITNNAAAALCTPLAIGIAEKLKIDAKPFIIIIMMGASASFCTPIGYQTNTMVWAPGGYHFKDFLKLGFCLTSLMILVSIFLVPIVFPF
mmetsp:Transcript_10053/g.15124  ORF Transcript_10053/g.15124 Transcript_10053/m.15124 type:complete len:720 (-) Transcript_10053:28-2187(-)